MKRGFFLIFFILTWELSFCQFNDSSHYYVKYGASGMINKTNDSRSFILNNAFTFTIRRKKISLDCSSTWIYGRQDGQLINNDFSSGLNFDLLKDARDLYYWGLINYTTSYSLKINYQFQVGAGIGYNLFRNDNLELVISDGILYEATDLQSLQIGKDTYQTFRNSLRIKHRWVINNSVILEGAHFWQPSISSFRDYIIRSSSALSVKLRKWLNITAAVTYNKLSRTNRENLLIGFGLTADKYF